MELDKCQLLNTRLSVAHDMSALRAVRRETMRSMEAYSRAAMERAMKVQDVMLQAMAKKITWRQGEEILGISDRHMRPWRERYVEEGYDGLFDRRRGKPSRRRVPVATVEKVFALYREKYFD